MQVITPVYCSLWGGSCHVYSVLHTDFRAMIPNNIAAHHQLRIFSIHFHYDVHHRRRELSVLSWNELHESSSFVLLSRLSASQCGKWHPSHYSIASLRPPRPQTSTTARTWNSPGISCSHGHRDRWLVLDRQLPRCTIRSIPGRTEKYVFVTQC